MYDQSVPMWPVLHQGINANPGTHPDRTVSTSSSTVGCPAAYLGGIFGPTQDHRDEFLPRMAGFDQVTHEHRCVLAVVCRMDAHALHHGLKDHHPEFNHIVLICIRQCSIRIPVIHLLCITRETKQNSQHTNCSDVRSPVPRQTRRPTWINRTYCDESFK